MMRALLLNLIVAAAISQVTGATAASSGSGTSQCLVLPAYNEEERLPVADLLSYVSSHENVKFLFVNDGSTDNTLKLLESIQDQAGVDKVAILDLAENKGKAEASRLGMLHAINTMNSDIVGFWDSDLATPLSEVQRFIDVFDTNPNVEMVFGARVALLGREINRYISRHYLGRVFATLTSVVLNLRIYDTQCGAKLFKVTSDLKRVLQDPFQSRWIFDVEIIARFLVLFREAESNKQNSEPAKLPEQVIYELPLLSWRDIAGSKLKLWDKLSALQGLARIYTTYFSPWKSWPVEHTSEAHTEL